MLSRFVVLSVSLIPKVSLSQCMLGNPTNLTGVSTLCDRTSDSQPLEEQIALTAQLHGAAATKRTHDISQTFDLYQKMQRIPPLTRGCRMLGRYRARRSRRSLEHAGAL